jgi:hypothetical protein
MPDPSAASSIVTEATLTLSKAPLAELAAAALRARKSAGLEDAHTDYVVLAVPGGRAGDKLAEALEARALEHLLEAE